MQVVNLMYGRSAATLPRVVWHTERVALHLRSVLTAAVYKRGRSRPPMDYESFFSERVSALKDEGRYRVFAELERRVGIFPKARLHRNGVVREVTIWCSNDYLAMGHHPVVLEAMHGAL